MTIHKNTATLERIHKATVNRIAAELNDLFRNKISTLKQLRRANELLAEYTALTKTEFELNTENSII